MSFASLPRSGRKVSAARNSALLPSLLAGCLLFLALAVTVPALLAAPESAGAPAATPVTIPITDPAATPIATVDAPLLLPSIAVLDTASTGKHMPPLEARLEEKKAKEGAPSSPAIGIAIPRTEEASPPVETALPQTEATPPRPGLTILPLRGLDNSYEPDREAAESAIPLLSLALTNVTLAWSASLDPAWEPLIAELEKDGFVRAEMVELFGRLGKSSYSPAFMGAKIAELYGVRGIGIDTDEETEPQLPEGYEQPISEVTVREYNAFTAKYKETLQDIRKEHGVGQNTIVALLLIETRLGSDLGKTPALRALASMAVTNTPAKLAVNGNASQSKRLNPARAATTLKTKADWAYGELKALIAYGKKHAVDIGKLPGSSYGAVGICQFMPSNIEPYGVDGDKDGKVDLFSVVDAMYSAANYLERHGWRGAKTKDAQFRVLLSYNQDNAYAAGVLGTSNQLALADKGKIAAGRNPVVSVSGHGRRFLDPSLRGGGRSVPPGARVKSLGNYEGILQ